MHHRDSLFPNRRETTAFGSHSIKLNESVRRQSSVSQLGRRTLAPGSLGATKTDPRPVRNGEYIRSCSARVETFVLAASPKDLLSPRAFVSPTARDFAIMWDTLFNAFDPRWCKKAKVKKLEDQVPSVLKGLGYTLSISKSALSAPGSTHCWPQIVLALDWIVDAIELKHKPDMGVRKPLDLMESDDSEDLILGLDVAKLFDWMTESYDKYLAFEDEAVKEIDQSRLSEIQSSQERQKQENAEKAKEVQQLEHEVQQMQKTQSPLAKMKTELEEMQQDERAFQIKIKQIEEMMGKLKKKSVEHETETENIKSQTKALETEIEELKIRVSKQSVNKEEITQLVNEKQKLDQMLQNTHTHKTSVERELNNREVQRDELLNQLQTCVHGYHNEARKLKLIPAGSKHSMGIDFSIHLDRTVTNVHDLCKADHKGTIQPGLLKVQEMYRVKGTQLNEDSVRLQQNCSKLKDEVQKLQQQRGTCVHEIQKVEHEKAKYNEATAGVRKQGSEQMKHLQGEIEQVLLTRTEMIHAAEQKLPEAEAIHQETLRQCHVQQEERTSDVTRLVRMMHSMRTTADDVLNGMEQLGQQACTALKKLIEE